MIWPFRKKRTPSPQWAREVVATIPAGELGNSAFSFAECALLTSNPATRAMHVAKLRAVCERIDREAGDSSGCYSPIGASDHPAPPRGGSSWESTADALVDLKAARERLVAEIHAASPLEEA